MFRKFTKNRLDFDALYCKNWISRILDCEILNQMTKIQSYLTLMWRHHQPQLEEWTKFTHTTTLLTTHFMLFLFNYDTNTQISHFLFL